MTKQFKKKNILITGGTGSFGKSIVKYFIKNKFPFNKIIIFSRDEFKQSEFKEELGKKNISNIRFFLGDIRDKSRLEYSLKEVDFLIHAAALKQVPAAEYNPIEFVKTNVVGAQNIIEASIKCNVERVVALSTDKAVAPINLYGATKLCSDKLFIAANNYSGRFGPLFSVVRYGNVLGSRGSVLPLFINQNKNNKPFTITSKEMTRFNILMSEAISLVINALNNSKGGEIFIPKLPSLKVKDLAKAINNKRKLIEIGVRPGEKIHEELFTKAEAQECYEFKDYYILIQPGSKKNNINLKKGKKINKIFGYNSKENSFLSISQINKILKNQNYL